jgi:hypothetical protein
MDTDKKLVKRIRSNKCWCGASAEYILLENSTKLCAKHFKDIEDDCRIIYSEEKVSQNLQLQSIIPTAFGKGIRSWAKGSKKRISEETQKKIIDETALHCLAEIVWETIPTFNKASYHKINVITKNDGVNIFFYSVTGKPLGIIDSKTGEIEYYFSREN